MTDVNCWAGLKATFRLDRHSRRNFDPPQTFGLDIPARSGPMDAVAPANEAPIGAFRRAICPQDRDTRQQRR